MDETPESAPEPASDDMEQDVRADMADSMPDQDPGGWDDTPSETSGAPPGDSWSPPDDSDWAPPEDEFETGPFQDKREEPADPGGSGDENAGVDDGSLDPELEDESPEDIAGGMASGGRKPKKAKKPAKKKKQKEPKYTKRQAKADRAAIASSMPMDDTRKQMLAACACVTAGFCCIMFLIFATIFACRTLGAKPRTALANPYPTQTQDGVYYDENGKMHVNVYISSGNSQPGNQITVYVLPDGSVTTEKPSDESKISDTMILYVDKDGNISRTPPKTDEEPDPGPETKEPEPDPPAATWYLWEDGTLSQNKPETGSWVPVMITVDENGNIAAVQGERQGTPSVAPEELEKFEIPGLTLYVLPDGTVTHEDPGDGSAHAFKLDFTDAGEPIITTVAPDTGDNDEPGSDPVKPSPYQGMDEKDLRAVVQHQRESGQGQYLDGDQVYIIQSGDNLTKLSHRFGFSVDFLAYYNNIANKNLIITGNVLHIPYMD